MTFKRVTSAVGGDATHFGGLDVNKFSDYLGGTDIGGSETVDIATLTTFRDSKFTLRNPANTFSYVFVPSAIAASRNVTLPLLTGNDTLVAEAFSQTLTNKTMDGVNNTFTNIAKSALPTTAVYNDQTNTYGDFSSIFRATRVKIRNPANTFSYTITGSGIAADRAVTLPILTGDDTIAFEAFTQTLTNKTINATNNTITDTSTVAGDLLKSNGTKFTRLAKGSANQLLATNSGATDLTWVNAPAGEVTLAGTETLTNKTVNTTDNTISATSQATGDILSNNGSKFVRKARGTALQVLRTNSGATDIEWASLDSERVGKSTASGNGSTAIFNIAHGLGSTPTYAFISVADCGSTMKSMPDYTVDSTNIVVTFNTAPESGSNNVVIYWRVVA